MSTVRKQVMIALAALSLGGAAMAAQADAQAPQAQQRHQWTQQEREAHRAEFQAKMAQHMKERAQKLHDALQLSAAQEPAWTTFVGAMHPAHPEAKRGEFRGLAQLPAPQRMQKMIELSKQRTARMESRLAALNTFYATLTPQQKKVFDEQTSRGMGGHGMGEHRQGGMRG
ncbi:hypothetical protein GCM10027321_23830 [Massilia terrae]|uniref:Spy/CpxP family protein refolding chaperone n=1 Tax=Massilia terrae TaxID=1811224 RepID=A0ABT2CXI9_9BURK|nr:Spy/CpxP family protein refolding chaperone [Massilia terrae]MCS0658691.1 Spy/CpxP family protein refolding chaperone [Massilia terrae]